MNHVSFMSVFVTSLVIFILMLPPESIDPSPPITFHEYHQVAVAGARSVCGPGHQLISSSIDSDGGSIVLDGTYEMMLVGAILRAVRMGSGNF